MVPGGGGGTGVNTNHIHFVILQLDDVGSTSVCIKSSSKPWIIACSNHFYLILVVFSHGTLKTCKMLNIHCRVSAPVVTKTPGPNKVEVALVKSNSNH